MKLSVSLISARPENNCGILAGVVAAGSRSPAPRTGRPLRFLAASALLMLLGGTASAQFATRVVVDGLNNPRGLAFGPDGDLYITEAGAPFSPSPGTPSITVRGQPLFFGNTGAITRWGADGKSQVLGDLPMLVSPTGEVTGAQGIGFSAAGDLYYTVGLGANPAQRVGAELGSLGQLMRLPAGGTTPQVVADIAGYEGANNPAGGPVDSNPYQLEVHGSGVLVADAGANALLNVGFDGTIDVVSTLLPLVSGAEAVPTSVAIGEGGDIFVSQLTGFPFPVGGASVFKVEDAGLTLVGSGFTNVIDMAYGPDGMLYVLELAHNGLLSGDPTGGLWRLNPETGQGNLIMTTGLVAPTALAFDDEGTLYIANYGTAAGEGQIIALRPVPEPAVTGAVAGLALVGVVLWRRTSSRKRAPAAGV